NPSRRMDSGWQQVGMVSDLAKVRCRRLFTERREDSIVLVHLRGQFFAMNAWCPHQGKGGGSLLRIRVLCECVCS
ncbi:hypothetical protein BOX15_Mlig014095g2, partial [Macrostomum lignano]